MEQKKQEIEENRPERKSYAEPMLVEWGALAELTGGTHGGSQDGVGAGGTQTFF